MDERIQFGKRLEHLLNTIGITRRFAAEQIHCTGATIGRWLRGEAPHCITVLAALRQKYSVDLNALICGEETLEHDREPCSEEELNTKRLLLRDQIIEIRKNGWVTCPCGCRLTWDHAYKCYGCGLWFCNACASRHFKMKRPLMATIGKEV